MSKNVSDLELQSMIFAPSDCEVFQLTPCLRFVQRAVGPTMQRVLQQQWYGSRGTVRWMDVPLVNDEG